MLRVFVFLMCAESAGGQSVSRLGENNTSFYLPQKRPCVEGAQRPNLKSEDSGFRNRFSEVKVSLWMCENGTGHEEWRHAGGLVGDSAARRFRFFLSVRETWKSATVG